MITRAAAIFFLLVAAVSVFLVGCELNSADSFVREVGVDFSGFYDSTATNADFVSPANSGGRVTSFNLRQTGDQLEAIDNHQYVFRGTIGEARTDGGSSTASFTLEGETTVGQHVTISGTLAGQGNSATITGTWIEPDRYCYLNGDGSINPIPTNTPQTNVTLSVSANPSSIALNGTSTLTATGGSGSYTEWSRSLPNLGTLSASSGQTVTYQANSSTGTNTVTVTDSDGATASATIVQGP